MKQKHIAMKINGNKEFFIFKNEKDGFDEKVVEYLDEYEDYLTHKKNIKWIHHKTIPDKFIPNLIGKCKIKFNEGMLGPVPKYLQDKTAMELYELFLNY